MPRIQLDIAVRAIEFARQYTRTLIDDLDESDWFAYRGEFVTHIAWQVGHLAMAEYALTMIRVRGKQPADADLISNDFFRAFQKGSKPNPDPATSPNIAEIRATFDRIHAQALRELANYADEELDVPLPEPHAVFSTKLGSVFFCSAHEMLHAGQIGLLRRQLGKPPLR